MPRANLQIFQKQQNQTNQMIGSESLSANFPSGGLTFTAGGGRRRELSNGLAGREHTNGKPTYPENNNVYDGTFGCLYIFVFPGVLQISNMICICSNYVILYPIEIIF